MSTAKEIFAKLISGDEKVWEWFEKVVAVMEPTERELRLKKVVQAAIADGDPASPQQKYTVPKGTYKISSSLTMSGGKVKGQP